MEEIPVCTGYEIDGKDGHIPADIRGLESIKPVYTKLKGWQDSTEGMPEFDKLPKAAQEYLRFYGAGVGGEDRDGFDGSGPGTDDGDAGVCQGVEGDGRVRGKGIRAQGAESRT